MFTLYLTDIFFYIFEISLWWFDIHFSALLPFRLVCFRWNEYDNILCSMSCEQIEIFEMKKPYQRKDNGLRSTSSFDRVCAGTPADRMVAFRIAFARCERNFIVIFLFFVFFSSFSAWLRVVCGCVWVVWIVYRIVIIRWEAHPNQLSSKSNIFQQYTFRPKPLYIFFPLHSHYIFFLLLSLNYTPTK